MPRHVLLLPGEPCCLTDAGLDATLMAAALRAGDRPSEMLAAFPSR